jgi:hypothetical protein
LTEDINTATDLLLVDRPSSSHSGDELA